MVASANERLGQARFLTFPRAVRGHPGIEDRRPWVSDMGFREDLSRLRSGHGPESTIVVRHVAMSPLRAAESAAGTSRRKLAGWSLACLDREAAQPWSAVEIAVAMASSRP
jgi:hypothetical protein